MVSLDIAVCVNSIYLVRATIWELETAAVGSNSRAESRNEQSHLDNLRRFIIRVGFEASENELDPGETFIRMRSAQARWLVSSGLGPTSDTHFWCRRKGGLKLGESFI